MFAEYKKIQDMYSEWQDGLPMPDESRTAPLEVLENFEVKKKTGDDAWRKGDVVRGHISDRLVIIYAVLRRLPTGGTDIIATVCCACFMCARNDIDAERSIPCCTMLRVPYVHTERSGATQAHTLLTALMWQLLHSLWKTCEACTKGQAALLS